MKIPISSTSSGLPGYQTEAPFVPSLLVEFRKRLNDEVLNEINEMIIAFNTPDDPTPSGGKPTDEATPAEGEENTGTLVLDATCAPQNIKYPQDVSLLNEAREGLEGLVDYLCATFGYYKPRMYRKNARKDYLNLAKSKKRSKKKIRRAIKQSNCSIYAGTEVILRHSLMTGVNSLPDNRNGLLLLIKFTNSKSTCMITESIPLQTGLSA